MRYNHHHAIRMGIKKTVQPRHGNDSTGGAKAPATNFKDIPGFPGFPCYPCRYVVDIVDVVDVVG